MAQLQLVGISFQSLPVALREEFALSNEKKEDAPILLKEIFGLSEIVCLYTCNRIEYYYSSENDVDPLALFCYFCQNPMELNQKIASNIYYYQGDRVSDHLFKVVSGLKSMVIGETQILNQVKKAYQISSRNGCLHKDLNGLFQFAFKTAKEIHRHTNLDVIKRSISSLSVELAESLLGSLMDLKILIIGTGETAELTKKCLMAKGYKNFLFMSKTPERANYWSECNGTPTLLTSELPFVLDEFDVVIACTDCQEPILKKEMILGGHLSKCKVLIDLGVPRNIESSIGEMQNIYLRNIDDMKGIIDKNHESRMREVNYAEEIISEAVAKFKSRQSLNELFHDIHENCLDEASLNLRKAIFHFQNNGNLDALEEEVAAIIIKSIEAPLDRFRSFANKIPPTVLNDYAFEGKVLTPKNVFP